MMNRSALKLGVTTSQPLEAEVLALSSKRAHTSERLASLRDQGGEQAHVHRATAPAACSSCDVPVGSTATSPFP